MILLFSVGSFIGGLFVGAIIGIIGLCLCTMAKDEPLYKSDTTVDDPTTSFYH